MITDEQREELHDDLKVCPSTKCHAHDRLLDAILRREGSLLSHFKVRVGTLSAGAGAGIAYFHMHPCMEHAIAAILILLVASWVSFRKSLKFRKWWPIGKTEERT